MRKIKVFALSLIFVLLLYANAFAELYTYNPITGDLETVSGDGAASTVSQVQLSPTSIYDVASREFRYYSRSSWNNGYVSSNVCDGEYTTGQVELRMNGGMEVEVYLDGDPIESDGDMTLSQCGAYLVKDTSSGKTIMEFTILNTITGFVYSYQLPSVYYLSSYTIDDKAQPVLSNNIDMTKEGEYSLSYYNTADGSNQDFYINIDHTAPELEILGVENGEAHQAVSFGDTESGAKLQLFVDGVETELKAEYTRAGNYHIVYTDEAGNKSEYEFTLYAFIDLKAWIVIAIVVCLIIALGAYMLYWRKHMPRS